MKIHKAAAKPLLCVISSFPGVSGPVRAERAGRMPFLNTRLAKGYRSLARGPIRTRHRKKARDKTVQRLRRRTVLSSFLGGPVHKGSYAWQLYVSSKPVKVIFEHPRASIDNPGRAVTIEVPLGARLIGRTADFGSAGGGSSPPPPAWEGPRRALFPLWVGSEAYAGDDGCGRDERWCR